MTNVTGVGVLSVAMMVIFLALPASAANKEPVDPSPMKMERVELANGSAVILQRGWVYAINRVGVKRRITQDVQYTAKDGSIISVERGVDYIQRPPRSAKSPRPTGLTLEEAAERAGVTYRQPQ